MELVVLVEGVWLPKRVLGRDHLLLVVVDSKKKTVSSCSCMPIYMLKILHACVNGTLILSR
jgi:hypothetical protein